MNRPDSNILVAFRGGIVVASALALWGCASTTKASTPRGRSPEPCAGRSVLVVRNHLDSEVEIIESRIGSGARTVVGIVGPGYREIAVANEPGLSYSVRRLSGGTTIAATSRPRVRDQRTVDLSFECREGSPPPLAARARPPHPQEDRP